MDVRFRLSEAYAGAKVGALISGLLTFVTLLWIVLCESYWTLPGLLFMFFPPALICVITLTLPGGLAGFLGAYLGRAIWGAVCGLVLFALLATCFVALTYSEIDPREELIEPVLAAAAIGYFSGGLATMFTLRRAKTPKGLWAVFRGVALYVPMVVVLVAWEATEIARRSAVAEIEEAGGMVTWNALNDSRGFYQVDFIGTRFKDSELWRLQPALSRVRHLDLHLKNCPITDDGVGALTSIPSLLRVHFERTEVTRDRAEELGEQPRTSAWGYALPPVEVYFVGKPEPAEGLPEPLPEMP